LLGVILRDSHGVAQVRWVTGNKIVRILKSKGIAPEIPEDLYHLIKKAVNIRKHLERSRKVRVIIVSKCMEEGGGWQHLTVQSTVFFKISGQRFQVSTNSCRVAHSPTRTLLQDETSAAGGLEIVSKHHNLL
jgi:hypothetical protein